MEVAPTFHSEGFTTRNAVQQMENALKVGVKGMESLLGRGGGKVSVYITRMAKEFFESNAVQIS